MSLRLSIVKALREDAAEYRRLGRAMAMPGAINVIEALAHDLETKARAIESAATSDRTTGHESRGISG